MAKNYFSPSVSIILLLSVNSAISANEEVIHLEWKPLRNLGEEVTGNNHSISPVAPPDDDETGSNNVTKIYCSDAEFPNDVFCNVKNLRREESPGLKTIITRVFLQYPHPSHEQHKCVVHFENLDGNSVTKLEYKSFACYDPPTSEDPDSTLLWLSNVAYDLKTGGIPAVPKSDSPNVKVRDLTELEIHDQGVVNRSLKCRRKFVKAANRENLHQSPQPPTPPSSVTFGVDIMACISSAPPQRLDTVAVQTTTASTSDPVQQESIP